MTARRQHCANRYQYDPLNRLASDRSVQFFYNGKRVVSEIQRDRRVFFLEDGSMPLAEIAVGDGATLLACDLKHTVLHSVSPAFSSQQAYSPFGHRSAEKGLFSLLGYNGEWPDSVTWHYLLGQGYRAYNPVLMRFNSPDDASPFGKGGINVYAYCENDPINHVDPAGKAKLHLITRRLYNQTNVSSALSRVKKSLEMAKKAEVKKAVRVPRVEGFDLVNTRHNVALKQRNASVEIRKTYELRRRANRRGDVTRGAIEQRATVLEATHKIAPADSWHTQLIPRLDTRPHLLSIRNYALPGSWDVQLAPDAMQPYVRVIRLNL